jgi:diaminopimelate decarboxylase
MFQDISSNELKNIATEFGTPVYVYNADRITHQYQKFCNAFSAIDFEIYYACKALTNINVLKHILYIGCNVDCSSINEVKLALHAGFPKEKILYTSNGISFEEIIEAKELGVKINIDSLSNLQKFAATYGNTYPVGIRVRPNIMGGGNLKISTGHNKSKFGIPVTQIHEVLDVVNEFNINIQNLHIHTGSDLKDVDVWLKGIQVLFELIPLFPHLQAIDLGGGFKVAYHENEKEVNLNELAKTIETAFATIKTSTGKPFQIWFEPGKYLVSQAGYFLTEVNVIKKSGDIEFVHVNSGFNHLIRPMFYDAYHKIENLSNPKGPIKKYAIVGNICETDTFAWDREVSEIKEKDLLVFYNAGAYGFEMSSNFNSRYKPAEVLVKNNKAYLIRKRDEFNDLLRNQIEI